MEIGGGKMKALKIGLPLVLAISLGLGIALPGMAHPETEEFQGRPPGMQAGEVVEKVVGIEGSQSYLVIQQGEQEPVQIAVDDGTEYFKVSAPGKVDGLLQNRMALRQRNQAQASDIKPMAPMNTGRFMRQRMGPNHQVRAVADDVKPGAPMRTKLMNAGRLGKMRGFDQLVSTPMVNPEPIPGEGMGAGNNRQRFQRFGEEATFDDIEVGDRVAVRLVPDQDEPVAGLVLIFEQASYDYQRITGTITDVSSDNQTITIAPDNDGEPVTLHYNEDTVFHLKGTIAVTPEQLAHAVYHADDMVAKVVRVSPEGVTEFGHPWN